MKQALVRIAVGGLCLSTAVPDPGSRVPSQDRAHFSRDTGCETRDLTYGEQALAARSVEAFREPYDALASERARETGTVAGLPRVKGRANEIPQTLSTIVEGDWLVSPEGRVARVTYVNPSEDVAYYRETYQGKRLIKREAVPRDLTKTTVRLLFLERRADGVIIETGWEQIPYLDVLRDFHKAERPVAVGTAGIKTLGMDTPLWYEQREGMIVIDDTRPEWGRGTVLGMKYPYVHVAYIGNPLKRYDRDNLPNLTQIRFSENGEPLARKILLVRGYYPGDSLRDDAHPDWGEGIVAAFLREEGRNGILIDFKDHSHRYWESDQTENGLHVLSIQRQNPVEQTFAREEPYSDLPALEARLEEMLRVPAYATMPFQISRNGKEYVLRFYPKAYSWQHEETDAILSSYEFAGGNADEMGPLRADIANRLFDTAPSSELGEYFDHNDILLLAPDRALHELRAVHKRFPGIDNIVIAEINIANILEMIRRPQNKVVGLWEKVEFKRVNFFALKNPPPDWRNRFGAVISFGLLERSILATYQIQEGWERIQELLRRPGIFVGQLDLESFPRLRPDDVVTSNTRRKREEKFIRIRQSHRRNEKAVLEAV